MLYTGKYSRPPPPRFIFAPLSAGDFKTGRIAVSRIVSLLTKAVSWNGTTLFASVDGRKLHRAKMTVNSILKFKVDLMVNLIC